MLQTTLLSLLFVLGLYGNCTGFAQDTCTFHPNHSDKVYSVPGDVALLNSDLLSPDVFNFTSVPYNITWYDSSGREIKNQTHKIVVVQEALWFLRVTQDDEGEYVAILRTPSACYTQNFTLKIDDPVDGKCERPRKADQTIYKNLSDSLTCPDNVQNYAKKLKSYNITYSMKWYKDCVPVDGGKDGYEISVFQLYINKVGDEHSNSYTCTLTFSLGGVNGSVSETISALVEEKYFMIPQVIRPLNETFRAQIGSNFSQECLVFVPSVGGVSVKVSWKVNGSLIRKSSKRIYVKSQSEWDQTDGPKGRFFKRELIFSEVKEEDFHRNYVCQVTSDKAPQQAYFTLAPPDPNIILPIGLILGGLTVVFLSAVTVFYCFKIDIMLCFRKAFPVFYRNKDLDGKLYDAYVAYPLSCDPGFSQKVEEFALHTLPQVLENVCGYKLFIAGRDCRPGEATVDSVEENLQASRRVLLLYTDSTFNGETQTSSEESWEKKELNASNGSSCVDYGGNQRQQLEWVAAMHRALLEESLKVVLVELEEISPAQLAHFPESVQQLRKKQGAVCWWKSVKKNCGTSAGRGKDEEKGGQDKPLSPSLTASSRFWKEIRYHMPVRRRRSRANFPTDVKCVI